MVTERNSALTASAYAPFVDAHNTGTNSCFEPSNNTPRLTNSAHRRTNDSGSFSGDRRTQQVSKRRSA